MGSVVHVHRVQYAVVEAHYSKARSEHFMIAYVKEKSLRQFIAAPRIIASGFSSENEAEDMLDALEAHQGRLRRLLLPPDAHLNTIADRLVGLVRSLFWLEKVSCQDRSPRVPSQLAQPANLWKLGQHHSAEAAPNTVEVCCRQ